MGDELLLKGTKDSENVWTSFERNSDGLVIKMVKNDDDGDATNTNPSDSRATFYVYGNSTYPGLVTEVRRLSELKPSGTCNASTATDCKRTIYAYTTAGLVDTIQEKGFTYNSSGVAVSYDFTTDWDYDLLGRVTKYKGPRTDTSDDVTDYTYHSLEGKLEDGYRKETKRWTSGVAFIASTNSAYDEWGNAIAIKDPTGDYTCLTFDDERNVITERRFAMVKQSSCATTHVNDLTTEFTYDTGRRLTKVKKPLGNCIHRSYDSWGRTDEIMSRDDCLVGSSGDNIKYTYSDDGLAVMVEYKDGSTVTYSQEMTYTAARRLETTLFTSATGSEKTFAYEVDGQLASVSDEDYGKTEYEHDEFGQVDLIKRFLVSTTTRDWTLTPGAEQNLATKVEDPASLDMDWVWDDMGRKVKQVTPESGTTLYLYDPAGNLTTRIENKGGSDEMTNTFSYDSLHRITEADYGDADCFTLGDAEIEYTYDTLAGCPTGTCGNGKGRLLRVETLMACDDSEPNDDAFDQQTYYGYDNLGRIIKETIEDDGGRSAPQSYSYDGNSVSDQPMVPGR